MNVLLYGQEAAEGHLVECELSARRLAGGAEAAAEAREAPRLQAPGTQQEPEDYHQSVLRGQTDFFLYKEVGKSSRVMVGK